MTEIVTATGTGAGIVVHDRRIDLAVVVATGAVGVLAVARQRLPAGVVVDGHVRDGQALTAALTGVLTGALAGLRVDLDRLPVRLGCWPRAAYIRTLALDELPSAGPTDETVRAALALGPESSADPEYAVGWHVLDERRVRVVVCPAAALVGLAQAGREIGGAAIELVPDAVLRALDHQGRGAGAFTYRAGRQPYGVSARWEDGCVVAASSVPARFPWRPGLIQRPAGRSLLAAMQPGVESGPLALAAQGLALAAAGGAPDPVPYDLAGHVRPEGTAAPPGWAVDAIAVSAPPARGGPDRLAELRRLRRAAARHRTRDQRARRPLVLAVALALALIALAWTLVPAGTTASVLVRSERPGDALAAPLPTTTAPVPALTPDPPATSGAPATGPTTTEGSTVPGPPRTTTAVRTTTTTAAPPAQPPTYPLVVDAPCHTGPAIRMGLTWVAGTFSAIQAGIFAGPCIGRKAQVAIVLKARTAVTSADAVKPDGIMTIGGFEWAHITPSEVDSVRIVVR